MRTDSKRATVTRIAELAGEEFDDVSTLDGIRVETDADWFLVRASGTKTVGVDHREACDEGDAAGLFETAWELVERAGEGAKRARQLVPLRTKRTRIPQ